MSKTKRDPKTHTHASVAGAETASRQIDELKGQLEQLKQDVQRANDQQLRALAELENTKKRLQREKQDFVAYASESVIRSLLPIVDSLDQALVAVGKSGEARAIVTGVELIHRQLLELLEREGVKRIATIGVPFDPSQHEAVAEVAPDGTCGDGTIIEEVQVGYVIRGKVLRPAMVKVAQQATPSTTPEHEQEAKQEDNRNAHEASG